MAVSSDSSSKAPRDRFALVAAVVVGLASVALLVAAGWHARRVGCAGYLYINAGSGADAFEAGKDPRAYDLKRQMAKDVAVTEAPRLARRTSHSHGGVTETDSESSLGPFTLYERETASASSRGTSASVGISGGCDDARIFHDRALVGSVQARYDPRGATWLITTTDAGGEITRVTGLKIKDTPGPGGGVPGSWHPAFAALALLLAGLAAWGARRHAARAGWTELTLDAHGLAMAAETARVKLVPEPPPHATVLARLGPSAPVYRTAPVTRTAAWVRTTHAGRVLRMRLATALAVAGLLGSVGLSTLELWSHRGPGVPYVLPSNIPAPPPAGMIAAPRADPAAPLPMPPTK